MLSKLLLAGSTLVAFSGDTDTTEVTAATVTLVTNTPEADAICLTYVGIDGAIEGLPLDAEALATFHDMADAYLVVMLEADTLRLTPEARDTFWKWLHTECTL